MNVEVFCPLKMRPQGQCSSLHSLYRIVSLHQKCNFFFITLNSRFDLLGFKVVVKIHYFFVYTHYRPLTQFVYVCVLWGGTPLDLVLFSNRLTLRLKFLTAKTQSVCTQALMNV